MILEKSSPIRTSIIFERDSCEAVFKTGSEIAKFVTSGLCYNNIHSIVAIFLILNRRQSLRNSANGDLVQLDGSFKLNEYK